MHAGSLDVRPEPLGWRIVQGQDQLGGAGQQGPDHLNKESSGDVIDALAGGGSEVAGLKLIAEFGGSEPTGDNEAAPS